MSKLIARETPMMLVECPAKWSGHKGDPGTLCIYECESEKNAGKHWFNFLHGGGNGWEDAHLRCTPGKMTVEQDSGRHTFDTKSGNHYVFAYAPGFRPPMPRPYAQGGEDS